MADSRTRSRSVLNRFRGCLLGGAVGDALGAPVEFLDAAAIERQFGQEGVRDFLPAYGRLGAITDDTQMTLFTAEGLIRFELRLEAKGISSIVDVVYRAYLRWLRTQKDLDPASSGQSADGWLVGQPALWARRAPGNTCLAALHAGDRGTPTRPLNDSKGCGAVMRMAPVGLVGVGHSSMERVFGLGCELGALTHGHPSGYLAAGFLAVVIARLCQDRNLQDAVADALSELRRWPRHAELEAAVLDAMEEAAAGGDVTALGEGWVAEEALAIALCSAFSARDFEDGIVRAVSHGGDSDSTGAIAGNILGAMHGVDAIPSRWLEPLEFRHGIERVAEDLATLLGSERPRDFLERYPPT